MIRALLSRLTLVALLAAVLEVGLISSGLIGSAAAHDGLVSSDPGAGSVLTSAPTTLTFTFDEPVQDFAPVVSLIGPDGRQYATGSPSIDGNVLTGTVGPGPAGAYTAAYRVVSADGHPVTGEVRFTLTGAAGPSGGSGARTPGSGVVGSRSLTPATTTSTAAAAVPTQSGSGGLSAVVWIGLVVAALVIAAAAVVLLRRSKPVAGDDH